MRHGLAGGISDHHGTQRPSDLLDEPNRTFGTDQRPEWTRLALLTEESDRGYTDQSHKLVVKVLVGIELHRLASTIQRLQLVHVFLGLLQMERDLQAHKARYATYKGGAICRFSIP